jgi:hypothetical protein
MLTMSQRAAVVAALVSAGGWTPSVVIVSVCSFRSGQRIDWLHPL